MPIKDKGMQHYFGKVADKNAQPAPEGMVIRYLDRVVVKDDEYEVRFKGEVIITV